jgi:serpin B
VKVSSVLQKAVVDVNEEGSEAAAATEFDFVPLCFGSLDPEFCCDEPFIFLIRDLLTGFIIFAGRVANPSRK